MIKSIKVDHRANASSRIQKLCRGQTPEEPPRALQASEVQWAAQPYERELLDPLPAPAR